MLQQTQVETVLSRFYHPFLKRFPSFEALAEASEAEVLKCWEGLGYYNRARNLHRAAKQAVGHVPVSVDDLLALPGIGQNTAHAIAAFAWRQPFPVLEANVKRVVARIFAFTQPTQAELWHAAAALLDHANPFDYNQAMMDIGAMVCTTKRPDCITCPANTLCKGKFNPAAYPAPKTKKTPPIRKRHILVVRNREGKIYATPRTEKFLGGLYHFIELDAEEETVILNGHLTRLEDAASLGSIRQNYSHFTLEAAVHFLDYPHPTAKENWHDLHALEQLPWSNAEKKVLEKIRENK